LKNKRVRFQERLSRPLCWQTLIAIIAYSAKQ
jgi:hypothetical protein